MNEKDCDIQETAEHSRIHHQRYTTRLRQRQQRAQLPKGRACIELVLKMSIVSVTATAVCEVQSSMGGLFTEQ